MRKISISTNNVVSLLPKLTFFFFHLDVTANHIFRSMTNDGLYQGSLNSSYTCNAEKTLSLNGAKGNITVDFQKLKIRTFLAKRSKFPNRK